MMTERITREQFDALTRSGQFIAAGEGGESTYRCGDDLVYVHEPGEVEYVRIPGYFVSPEDRPADGAME